SLSTPAQILAMASASAAILSPSVGFMAASASVCVLMPAASRPITSAAGWKTVACASASCQAVAIASVGALAFTRDESCSIASRVHTTCPAIQIFVLTNPSGPLKCISLQCLGSMSEKYAISNDGCG